MIDCSCVASVVASGATNASWQRRAARAQRWRSFRGGVGVGVHWLPSFATFSWLAVFCPRPLPPQAIQLSRYGVAPVKAPPKPIM